MNTRNSLSPARAAFIALLVIWAASPILVNGLSSQDGPAFITAGKLVRQDPQSLYPEAVRGDSTEAWRNWNAVYCKADPSGNCLANHSGWLGPPSAALLYSPFSLWSPKVNLLLLRLLSVGPIIAAYALCWWLLDPRSVREQYYLVAATLLCDTDRRQHRDVGPEHGFFMVSAGILRVMVVGSRTRVDDLASRPPEPWSVAIVVGLSVMVATEVKMFPVVLLGAAGLGEALPLHPGDGRLWNRGRRSPRSLSSGSRPGVTSCTNCSGSRRPSTTIPSPAHPCRSCTCSYRERRRRSPSRRSW